MSNSPQGQCRLSFRASTNIRLTILSRGEFSIIMANLAQAGGLLAIVQPFAALYVLVLAILGPLLTTESPRLPHLLSRVVVLVARRTPR